MTRSAAVTLAEPTLHAALELSKNSWLLAIQFPDRDAASLYPLKGGDAEGLMAKLDAARDRVATEAIVRERTMLIFDMPEIEAFWRQTCDATGTDPETPHHAGTFAEPVEEDEMPIEDQVSICEELSRMARDGEKHGTTHTQLHFEQENIRMREPGDCWIVTTVAGAPLCVVRITKVEIMPFDQVGEIFAASEGEGDLSLEYWRRGHLAYFKAQCRHWSQEWRDDRPVVCESFELVHRP